MFVDVEFPIELPATVTVPVDAIVDSGLRKTVYVDRGDGFFELRPVETGWRFGDRVEIIRGLEPGEQIAVAGLFLLDSESRMRAAAVQLPARKGESGMEKMDGSGKGQAGRKAERDPVCGMDVDITVPGVPTAGYQGRSYYFCNPTCRESFLKDPSKYLSK